MADTDIIVSEMIPASQINTGDLMIMTQPDAQAETGYSTKSATVLQVANKQLKGIDFPTDLPSFDDPNVLGGLEELKADIKALLPVSSAVGNPCTFETDISDTLVSLKAAIVASGGNGTPSSPIPIVGHSELNLVRCGKNLLPNLQGQRTATSIFIGQTDGNTYPLLLKANVNYHLSFGATGSSVVAYYRDTNGNTRNISSSGNFSVSEDMYVQMWLYSDSLTSVEWFQLELGSTATAYEPYNGTPYLVSFGQTVYGGVYDANAGKVTITHGYILVDENTPTLIFNGSTANSVKAYFDCSGKANGTLNMLSDRFIATTGDVVGNVIGRGYSNGVEFSLPLTVTPSTEGVKQWFADNPTQLVYELATPIEIDVSELSVDTIVGTNNIVSDCGGDVEVQYRDSIQHYIDSKIASVQALIL